MILRYRAAFIGATLIFTTAVVFAKYGCTFNIVEFHAFDIANVAVYRFGELKSFKCGIISDGWARARVNLFKKN